MQSIITILGPTAIGKSKLAIELAKEFSGTIISADSRQVYKNFDIGSGKITIDEMQKVPHYMLDIKEIWEDYNVAEFQREVKSILKELDTQQTIPFLVGGTGLYIESIIYNYQLSNIPVQNKLRVELSQLNKVELQNKLLSLNPQANLNQSDWNNPVRLIRAIEISGFDIKTTIPNPSQPYTHLLIGLTSTLNDIKNRIITRVEDRLEKGVVEEVKKIRFILNKKLPSHIAHNKMQQLGLGTIAICDYLDNKIDYETMKNKYTQSEYQYARRQLTWFRRMSEINWFEVTDKNLIPKVTQLISAFL
jgi:tRNA dimethylallyltransferase